MAIVLSTLLDIGLVECSTVGLEHNQNELEIRPSNIDELQDSAEAKATLNLSQPEPLNPHFSELTPLVYDFLLELLDLVIDVASAKALL